MGGTRRHGGRCAAKLDEQVSQQLLLSSTVMPPHSRVTMVCSGYCSKIPAPWSRCRRTSLSVQHYESTRNAMGGRPCNAPLAAVLRPSRRRLYRGKQLLQQPLYPNLIETILFTVVTRTPYFLARRAANLGCLCVFNTSVPALHVGELKLAIAIAIEISERNVIFNVPRRSCYDLNVTIVYSHT